LERRDINVGHVWPVSRLWIQPGAPPHPPPLPSPPFLPFSSRPIYIYILIMYRSGRGIPNRQDDRPTDRPTDRSMDGWILLAYRRKRPPARASGLAVPGLSGLSAGPPPPETLAGGREGGRAGADLSHFIVVFAARGRRGLSCQERGKSIFGRPVWYVCTMMYVCSP
jgi:hypothetical protein